MGEGLEEHELLLDVADDFEGLDLEDTEADGLRERSALADGHDVADLDGGEAGSAMSGGSCVAKGSRETYRFSNRRYLGT